MASLFTHAFSALTFSRFFAFQNPPVRIWSLGILCSVLPDLDVITFAFGISYGDFWGHRGFSHSIFFALIFAFLVTLIFFKNIEPRSSKWFAVLGYFFICTASHGFFDAMTNGGLGVAFFAPFDNTRYFLPWQPVQVSPIGVANFFSEWGLRVIISEFLWIWLPALVLAFLFGKLKSK
ncbi:metal-dependent hydrolase [candidate division KSB1 bacterium]|nr:metal-dependent hydrolase [candidate division KSB1 bacterium]